MHPGSYDSCYDSCKLHAALHLHLVCCCLRCACRKLEELATEAQRQQAALAAVAQRLELVSGQLMELMGRQPTPQEVERFKEAKTRVRYSQKVCVPLMRYTSR
jgi:DNA repair ATPase RecN